MDVGDEHLPHGLRRPKERRLLAVTGIDTNPFKPHPPGARLTHDVERMRALRGQPARGQRHPGFVTARRVLDPAFRQIQPHVDRDMAPAAGQHAEHRDPAIVGLPLPPGPLPRHADRAVSLLGEAAFVEDQGTARLAAGQSVGVLADLPPPPAHDPMANC